MKKHLIALAAGTLLAAIAAQPALAQDKAAKVVSRDELRTCMNTEAELAAKRKALQAGAAANREEQNAISAEAEELNKEKARVEEDSRPMARDRFERKVRQHNQRVSAANEKMAGLRTELETLNKALVAYNDKCGGIAFRPEDKEAILKEREAAGK